MTAHLEYLMDQVDGKIKTFQFRKLQHKDKVESVSVSVYDGKLTEEQTIKAEVESFISLTAHDWATLLACVQVTLSSKRR